MCSLYTDAIHRWQTILQIVGREGGGGRHMTTSMQIGHVPRKVF